MPARSRQKRQRIHSRSALRRRVQAGRNLAQNLIVVRCDCPLHVNPGALHSRFLRQALEFSLQKKFQFLRRQEGNLDRRRLAAPGLDLHAVWRFELLRFQCQALPPFIRDEGGGQKWKHSSVFGASREIRRYRSTFSLDVIRAEPFFRRNTITARQRAPGGWLTFDGVGL